MGIPSQSRYVIVGAGIHGLSTAWKLAQLLESSGKGSGKDILVIDKTGVAAGASGIACGVIRNNYFQPAMRELMAHSVNVWDSDPKTFHYHPVGYMQISHEGMHEDIVSIFEQQQAIGYESTLVEGKDKSTQYMKALFSDWRAQGITSVLHEKRGGYANNVESIKGLERKARAHGVKIETGVTVTGFKGANGSSSAISAVETNKGVIECDEVIIAAGPWIKTLWDMMELPKDISIKGADGVTHDNIPTWRYWCLEEGVLGVDPDLQKTNDGKMPPVIHVDTDATLVSDTDGTVLREELWGIYYKPDFNFGGVQGGAMPYEVMTPADNVAIDPYGAESPDFIVGEDFANMWTSALAFCQERFSGKGVTFKKEPSGGLGCFTPDSFPIFDRFRENVHIIADSNHGYKMIGVGHLIAEEIMGNKQSLLEPFRFSRYHEGKLHPISNSPYPWS